MASVHQPYPDPEATEVHSGGLYVQARHEDVPDHQLQQEANLAESISRSLAGSRADYHNEAAYRAEHAIQQLEHSENATPEHAIAQSAMDMNNQASLNNRSLSQDQSMHEQRANEHIDHQIDQAIGQRIDFRMSGPISQQMEQRISQQLPHSTPGEEQAETPDRRRSKVSQACDNCRKKKVKCTGDPNNPDVPCAQCLKVAAQKLAAQGLPATAANVGCTFSRQPLKRGPCKGYIKDLADRVISLEHQFGRSPHEEDVMMTPISNPRKRTHSEVVGDGYSPEQGRSGLPSWSFQPSSTPGQHQGFQNFVPQFSPPAEQMSWQQETQEHRRRDPVLYQPQDEVWQWDEEAVTEFYKSIQHTFPVLQWHKAEVHSHAQRCPSPSAREAFFIALDLAVRSYAPSAMAPLHQTNHEENEKKVLGLLRSAQSEGTGQALPVLLLSLQTNLLMAIACDNMISTTMKLENLFIKADWIGRALYLADIIRLHPRSRSEEQHMSKNEEMLARQLWWVLYTLDRWHSVSTGAKPRLEEVNNIDLDDKRALGGHAYQVVRLTQILSRMNNALRSYDLDDPQKATIVQDFSTADLEHQADIITSIPALRPVHCFLRLFITRLYPTPNPQDVATAAEMQINLLASSDFPVSPFNYHLVGLSLLTLFELGSNSDYRDIAVKSLATLQHALNTGSGCGIRSDNNGWDAALREVLAQWKPTHGMSSNNDLPTNGVAVAVMQASGENRLSATASQSLEHLAEAAVGERNSSPSAMLIDTKPPVATMLEEPVSELSAPQPDRTAGQIPEPQLQSNHLAGQPPPPSHPANHSPGFTTLNMSSAPTASPALGQEAQLMFTSLRALRRGYLMFLIDMLPLSGNASPVEREVAGQNATNGNDTGVAGGARQTEGSA